MIYNIYDIIDNIQFTAYILHNIFKLGLNI